jgi:hypothetical protein
MKLSITDQFLWDIFNATSELEDTLRFLVHPPRTFGDIAWDSDSPIYRKYRKILNSQKFSQLVYYLKKNNLIKVEGLKSNCAIMLTKKGFDKAVLTQFNLENDNLEKRKDGKWVMLIFDVPEKNKKSRELLRSILHKLKYNLFQKSVWVSPYDVSNRTEDLLQEYSLDHFVKMFLIEEIKA